jgi:hypothetical protein
MFEKLIGSRRSSLSPIRKLKGLANSGSYFLDIVIELAGTHPRKTIEFILILEDARQHLLPGLYVSENGLKQRIIPFGHFCPCRSKITAFVRFRGRSREIEGNQRPTIGLGYLIELASARQTRSSFQF